MRAAYLLMVALLAIPMAHADIDPEALYKLAKQAQIQAQIQVDLEDSQRVHDLLERGGILVEAIMNSTDSYAAGENFLAAMGVFSEIFEIINEDSESGDEQPYYAAVLERQSKYYDHLLELAHAYSVAAPVEELDRLFAQAAAQIEAGDPQVAGTLESINHMTDILREQIGSIAAGEDRERALEYAALYVKHLDDLLAGDSLDVLANGVETVTIMRDRLISATEPSSIISIISEVIMLKHDIDEARIGHLETEALHTRGVVEYLLEQGIVDQIEYDAIEATFSRFYEEMDAGDLDEAETILMRLNNWLIDKNS